MITPDRAFKSRGSRQERRMHSWRAIASPDVTTRQDHAAAPLTGRARPGSDGRTGSGMRFDPGHDAAGIHRTGRLSDDAPLRKQHDRWNAANPEPRHQRLLFVPIHLEEPE